MVPSQNFRGDFRFLFGGALQTISYRRGPPTFLESIRKGPESHARFRVSSVAEDADLCTASKAAFVPRPRRVLLKRRGRCCTGGKISKKENAGCGGISFVFVVVSDIVEVSGYGVVVVFSNGIVVVS